MPATIAPERTFGERREAGLPAPATEERDLVPFLTSWPPDHGRVLDRVGGQVSAGSGGERARRRPGPAVADRELLSEVVHELGRQPRAVVEALARALRETREDDPLDPARWGAPPDSVAYLQATYEAARAHAQFDEIVARRSETVQQAAARLRIDPSAVTEAVTEGALVGIERDGKLLLPTWQFSDRSAGNLLPGLRALQQSFPGDALALTSWVVEPSDALGGRTPRDRLEAGDVEAVIAVADAIGT